MIWLLLLPAAYLLICLLLFFFQERLIFMPYRELEPVRVEHQELWLDSAEGQRVHAWWLPARDLGSRGALLFCHGNAGNISHREESLLFFRELGFSVLIFDYPGYGKSEGSPSQRGSSAAADAAYAWLLGEGGFAPEQVLVFGRSLGGAVAALLAGRQKAEGRAPGQLVIESSFASLVSVAQRQYPWLPVGLLLRHPFDARAALAELEIPTLVVHSPGDEIVPFELGQEIYDRLPGPKSFLTIQGPHNGGWIESLAAYRAGWQAFLAER
jgi:fermentation-respiration switch protein FrsA (DUF1100 family)